MLYSTLELATFFFIYGFLGWCGEVCVAAFHKKKFVNRGFVTGPICHIYGIAAVLYAVFLPELREHVFLLFLGGAILSSVLEYVTGKLMEHIFHKKLWDYSDQKYNLDGYICLPYSLLWGILTVVSMLYVNPLLCSLIAWIPNFVLIAILIGLSVVFVVDMLITAMSVLGMHVEAKRLLKLTQQVGRTSRLLENALTKWIQKRMQKSFPGVDAQVIAQDWRTREKAEAHFAEGCGYYKLVSLFFLGAFLGDIVETIFCRVTAGVWMSRSSVVYGPFSIVWGLGCALLTWLLYRYKDKSDRYIFIAGTLLGGAYEYICSVFTELVFGTVFWDYSEYAFNLGGRINLTYCMFWGIAAVVWLKMIYPFLSKQIERLPMRLGKILCNAMVIFMVFNMLVSALALNRYVQRSAESPDSAEEIVAVDGEAVSGLQQTLNSLLDAHFPDERMEKIYPNAKIVSSE